jgi:hypothetical protein
MLRIFLLSLIIVSLPVMCLAKGMPPSYQIFHNTAFVNGFDPCLIQQGSAMLTDAPGGGTGKVLKVDASRNGPAASGINFSGCNTFKLGREYMVTWTSFIPPDYITDKNQPEKIFEIHQGKGEGQSPLALSLHNGHYQADLHNGSKTHHYYVGPAGDMGKDSGDKGYWVRWSLHYRPDSTGKRSITDLYKNDVLVMTAPGVPNAYPQDNNAYLKVGIVKNWTGSGVTRRTLYFGDVAIGAKP